VYFVQRPLRLCTRYLLSLLPCWNVPLVFMLLQPGDRRFIPDFAVRGALQFRGRALAKSSVQRHFVTFAHGKCLICAGAASTLCGVWRYIPKLLVGSLQINLSRARCLEGSLVSIGGCSAVYHGTVSTDLSRCYRHDHGTTDVFRVTRS
jgi:hypothetical protein